MLIMKKEGLYLLWMIAFVFSSGCAAATSVSPTTTQNFVPPLTPYQVNTITPTIKPTATSFPTDLPLLPSPTPFKHVIQPGDTLYGIALKYNISLDKLVSANPEVDTSILTIGIEINIPFEGAEDLSVPTPTPYPIFIGDPVCQAANDGGMWCFSVIHNNQNLSLENIGVAINLYDSDNTLVQSHIAIPPLDYVFPDQKIPVSVYINQPLPEIFQATAILITSFPGERDSPLTEILNHEIQYSENQAIAQISGAIRILESTPDEGQIWVAAAAYAKGDPVGIRKWVSNQNYKPGEETLFEMILYSFGPPIDEIQLFSELH